MYSHGEIPLFYIKFGILPDNVPLDDEIGEVPVVSEKADLASVEGGDSGPKAIIHICYLNISKHGIYTKIDKS